MSENEAICHIAGRKYTMFLVFRKIIKIVLCILILLLTFWAGDFRGWTRRGLLTEVDGVYVYDTQQKLENYYEMFEKQFCLEAGLPPASPKVREFIDKVRELGRPLVAVGPFRIFVDNEGDKFSVREIQHDQVLSFPLVELECREQSKYMEFTSSYETGLRLPRFRATFIYSEDGSYRKGCFAVQGKDVMFERFYVDTKGIGVFDKMRVFENSMQTTYHLNGLSWEKVDEQQYPEALKTREDDILKHTQLFRDGNQFDRNPSNDDHEVYVESK